MNYDKDIRNTSLIRYIEIILSYKKLIFISTITTGVVVAFLMFFVAKPVFLSTGTVKTVSKSGLGISGLLSGANLPDIGGLDELSGGGSAAKELALYEQILSSRRCLEELIVKFNLIEQYDFKYMQDAIKNFREGLLYIVKDVKSGTITVGVYDYSPQKSKDMSDFLIEQLNKINIEMNVQNASNNRIFIEERYNLVKKQLSEAEDSLKMFQDIYGIAPDIIVRATTQASITLESEIKAEEIKLELLRKLLSPDQSEVKTQETKIAAMKKQLNEIQNTEDPDTRLKLKGTPQTILDYVRLTRSVEIQNKLLVFLLPIYEQAKIEEVKEMPSVAILDPPVVPEIKVKPKRLTITLIATLAVFLLLTFSAIMYELYIKYFLRELRIQSDK
ncbi:MAG: GNVR domain-containing protein [Candidatus Kapaibacterium sp.]